MTMPMHKHYKYPKLLDSPTYNPTRFFDQIKRMYHLKNDAALARLVQISPVYITKIRQRKNTITGDMLLRFHDVTGLSVKELREMMGAPAHDLQYVRPPKGEK